MDFPITARDNKRARERERAQYEWVDGGSRGGVRHNKGAVRGGKGVKECEAETVRDKEGAGMNKSIVHGCGMKGCLLPVCD